MSKKTYIYNAIEKKAEEHKSWFIITWAKYSLWYIGITSDIEANKKRHKNPKTYFSWECETEKDAREIELYFQDKGMKGAGGGGTNNWEVNKVYIYLIE